MAQLKVKFAQVENGWAQLFLWADEEKYERWFSRIVYGDAFARLCEALLALEGEEKIETVVTWMAAPQEYEMRFLKTSNEIRFDLWCFDQHERSISKPPELEFSIFGTYDEVCLPLWRALRELQGRYTEADFKTRWTSEFPTRELAFLSARLGKI